jgi:hypothetical protein
VLQLFEALVPGRNALVALHVQMKGRRGASHHLHHCQEAVLRRPIKGCTNSVGLCRLVLITAQAQRQ